MDKMGLIEISAAIGDIRPINSRSCLNFSQRPLEAPDPAKKFWR
jgi:hypothetical protein